MEHSEIAIPLIQLIALFLPAWAIVMQVFSREINSQNFEGRPQLIPLVALGLIASSIALYLFGRAGFDILLYFRLENAPGNSGPLINSMVGVGAGILAFVVLGLVLIMILVFRGLRFREMGMLISVGVGYLAAIMIGIWVNGGLIIAGGVLAVYTVSTLYLAFKPDRGLRDVLDGFG